MMKKLTRWQAAKYAAEYYKSRTGEAPCEDELDEFEKEISALIYMSCWSKNAREIVGAVKLLKVLDILRAKTITFDDGWGYVYKALYPQDVDEIEKIILDD